MNKNVTIREGQTLFDLSLQYLGDATRALELVNLNSDVFPSLMAKDFVGKTIIYEEQKNQISEFFETNEITITTQYPEYKTGAAAWSLAFSPAFVSPPTL